MSDPVSDLVSGPVLVAFSGGLDTSWLVALLTREGRSVTALTVDCGGFTPAEQARVRERALAAGALEHRFVDAKERLFDRVLRWCIAGNVRRGQTYPISVAAERGIQAEVLAEVARAEGFAAVAHGSTGAGNDQVRFEAALAVVAEGLDVLAPVRDLRPSREDEARDLEAWGLPVPSSGGGSATYSVNAGLWGLTIGGGELKDTTNPLPEEGWEWTRGAFGADGAGTPGDERIEIAFEEGVPVALTTEHGSRRLTPVALIEELNALGGSLGVGRGYHLGDTILGIKGRIAYEAPAAEILLTAHRELEKLVLTEDQRFWKDHLGEVYGKKLHQGLLHDPLLADLEALFASAEERVTGTVAVRLIHGRAVVEGVASPFGMMNVSDATYGERPSGDSDPRAGAAVARVLAEPARLARRASTAAHGFTTQAPTAPVPALPAGTLR